ncbi:MAG: ABC transporter ATP-binding protein [Actinobacteria bacterium]|nr:MAG: ABC transporter ATP-binding protein [Actinomycetota bacterium]
MTHSIAEGATPGASSTGEAGSASPAPAFELHGITKRFGDVVACDRVDLTVERGEIHGLLGQNGAGKTTLMRILLGLHTADAGQIRLHGHPVMIKDPLAAAAMGLAMVHQHFSVIPALRVWENVTLGEKGRIDAKRAARDVEALGARYGLEVHPNARVENLTMGQRQRVEIIKCLRRNPDILILDEPTSVLTMAESQDLFDVLRRVVQEEGRAVVLISHKLDEILNATDRVTIMRAGRVAALVNTHETNAHELAHEMLGRDVSLRSDEAAAIGLMSETVESLEEAAEGATPVDSPVVLQIRDAVAWGPGGRRLLDRLSLEVRRGEILGVAGVEGNGQVPLSQVMSSLLELKSGTVEVNGKQVRTGRPGAMLAAGVGVIPEDRHESGCVLDMTVAENLLYTDLDEVSSGLFVNRRKVRAKAEQLVREFDIMTPSTDTPMRSLSGGNQQRLVLARELARHPAVLIASQPTQGLDVGAIEYVTARLRAAAEAGVAVLLISTELEEILTLSDRVAVIYRGHILGEMTRDETDLERLGLMMGGHAA